MPSPSSIRRFLESLRIENSEDEEQIINNIINRLSFTGASEDTTATQQSSTSTSPKQNLTEEEKRKFEDTLRCKFVGSMLAKIGDRFLEKYSTNQK